MVIDTDVRNVAKHFGIDSVLLQAVVRAEGDIIKAVQCSVPSVKTRDEALRVTARSIAHALSDYVLKHQDAGAFVEFFGARWAPVGASNDPSNLNVNWVPNVKKLLGVSVEGAKRA